MIKKLLQGMVVGIANIIPGVSGGTMMVAMGLYDKLIHAVTHLKSEFKNSLKPVSYTHLDREGTGLRTRGSRMRIWTHGICWNR